MDMPGPVSSEYGTYETVNARFWPCVSGKSRENLFPARKLHINRCGLAVEQVVFTPQDPDPKGEVVASILPGA